MPFNLSNTADREAAGPHKERPQCPMTASSAQVQHSPSPLVNRPLFLLERKDGGVRGNAHNSSPSVGEAGSTHQSEAVSARGGHPEVSHPPGRHAGGWGASPGPGLHQSATPSPSDVSVVLKNDTQAFGRAKTQMLFKVRGFKITTSVMISLNKQLISFVSA